VSDRVDPGAARQSEHEHSRGDGQLVRLSSREREVVVLVARGHSNREIASALVITPRTADTHVGNILGKLGLHTRAQVAVWAVQHGLIPTRADVHG